jgi:hypothetical protein
MAPIDCDIIGRISEMTIEWVFSLHWSSVRKTKLVHANWIFLTFWTKRNV